MKLTLTFLLFYFFLFVHNIYSQSNDSLIDQFTELRKEIDDYDFEEFSLKIDSISMLIDTTSKSELSAHYFYTQAKCLILKPDYKKSIKLYNRALESKQFLSDSIVEDILTSKSISDYLAGDINGSMKFFEGLLEKDAISANNRFSAHLYIASGYLKKVQFDSANFHLNSVLEIYQKNEQPYDSLYFAYTKFLEGRLLWKTEKLDKAKESLLKSIEVYRSICGENCFKMRLPYEAIANLYAFKTREYKKAVEWFDKTIDLVSFHKGENSINLYSPINNLGTTYSDWGEPEKAIVYKQKAIDLVINEYGPDYHSLGTIYQSTSLTYLSMDDLSQAIDYAVKAERIYRLLGDNNPKLLFAYNAYALIYKKMEDYDRSIEYFLKVREIVAKNYGKDHSWISFTYANVAGVLVEKQEFEKAIQNYKKAIAVSKTLLGPGHPRLIWYTNNMALAHMQALDFNSAIEACKTVFVNHPAKNENDFLRLKDPLAIRNTLLITGDIYYQIYAFDNNKRYLDSSFYYFEKGLELMDFIRRTKVGDLTSFLLNGSNHGRLSSYAMLCNLIDQNEGSKLLEAAYHRLEKFRVMEFRANYLSESSQNSAKLFPLEIIHKADSLHARISSLNSSLKKIDQKEEAYSLVSDSLYSTNRSLQAFLKAVKDKHPEYFQWRYDEEVIDVASIQNDLLKENEAIIQFQNHSEIIYSFVITKTSFDIIEDSLSIDLKEVNNEYLTSMRTSNNDELSLLESKLGDQILEKSLEKLSPNINELVIIPDGIIYKIPIESLRPSVLNGASVFDRYNVRYAISSSILKKQTKVADSQSQRLLTVTPSFIEDKDSLTEPLYASLVRAGNISLPGAKAECEAISKIGNGQIFDSQKRDKGSFLEIKSNYDVLHLSMHAFLNHNNPQGSYLLLRNDDKSSSDRLYGHEICAETFDHELVVLSACNTSVGPTVNGNGISSLSQAFFQAGVNSTVTSLWKVPDKSTSQIMKQFYIYLNEGLSKSESLRKSKQDYLDNAMTDIERSPYYWAGFILTGGDGPINFNADSIFSNLGFWIYPLCLLFLFTIGYLIKKKLA